MEEKFGTRYQRNDMKDLSTLSSGTITPLRAVPEERYYQLNVLFLCGRSQIQFIC